MRIRILAVVAVAVAATLCLSACSGGSPAGSAASAINSTFTYATNQVVMTDWDPATDYSNENIAMNNMYDTLTRYDTATGKVLPRLATSWTTSADGLTWTFHLQPGVKFNTGHSFDSTVAKAAIERTVKLKGDAAYIWDPVRTIDTPDPDTLIFHLKHAAPMDLIASSEYGAFMYDTAATTGNLKAWFGQGHSAGTGPYEVVSWHKGQEFELRLKANPTYWGGWKGAHYTKVVFRVVPQATTEAQLLQANQVTFVQRLTPALFASAGATAGVKTSTRPSFENLLAMLNTASGPLVNEHVRQAVQDAIDYPGIVTALKGAATASSGVIPQGLLGYDPNLAPAYNPAKAKQLIAAAGYGPGGKSLKLTLTYAQGDPDQQLVATLMKSELAQVGVQLNVRPLEFETQWALAKSSNLSKRQDIFVFYWYPDYADPYSWFINMYHSANPPFFNLSYWDDKSVDTTIDSLQSLTATNRTAAQAKYTGLQRTILDQAISPVLYVQNYERAYRSTLAGYVDNPAYANVVFVYDVHPTA